MNLLVIGSGGREHALVWKLRQSSGVGRIFCAPGNAGTAQISENVAIPANDLPALVQFAKQNQIGLTVVGPDDPLAAGVVDLFAAEGLRVFGPSKAAARLESSKIFAKELMQEPGFQPPRREPSSAARSATLLRRASISPRDQGRRASARERRDHRARCIERGRGHRCDDGEETIRRCRPRVVIEECLRGSECSLHALVDGKNYRMLATARDHKRAYDGDLGPNTGGMGAFSPANNWNESAQAQFEHKIMQPC